MNIVIVTSGHPPFDERIFYKFGLSLKKYKHKVTVLCSTEKIETEVDGINVRGFDGNSLTKKEKIKKLYEEIVRANPSLIICCEPLTILAAHRYKKEKGKEIKIISDITEYYPHQNILHKYSGIMKLLNHLRYFFFNIYVTNLVNYLFIGEDRKAGLYNKIAPTKKKTIIGYYPPAIFFNYSPPLYDGKYFTLCYTGIISEARGFNRFVVLVSKAAERFPDKIFIAKILGRYEQPELKKLTEELSTIKNVEVDYTDWVDYKNFAVELSRVDLCIDLRDKNKVFNRSLPIKVFDYMACGIPVIYSSLDSFKEFEDVKKFGILVEPDDIDAALNKIKFYLNNPGQLKKDSQTARNLFEEKYNWEIIETKMIEAINTIFKNQ
jgi:glycosyltransferase involved in cell wall biosynthesis